MKMKKIFLAVLLVAVMLSACVVPGRRGPVVVVPPLPSIVVLEEEPYYYHSGYYYYYQNDRWSYSKSRSGPWAELPRGHYPKEVRFKERGRSDERDRGLKRGHDKRDKD
jgi:hypothetical protein